MEMLLFDKGDFLNRVVVHQSQLDRSVNFVLDKEIEARLVFRDSTAVIYLSSQRGCTQSCRMCHLTHKRLLNDQLVTHEEFLEQTLIVAQWAAFQSAVQITEIHVNFMARGEPLLNPALQDPELWMDIRSIISLNHPATPIEFKVSTIFPIDRKVEVIPFPVDLYYSLYSVDYQFRKKWLPKAAAPARALEDLLVWHRKTGSRLYIHHALIAGQNDSTTDADACVQLIKDVIPAGFVRQIRLNIVRFNPPDVDKYQEASDVAINSYTAVWRSAGFETQVVGRVGFDVSASCGMFIG